MKYTEVIPDKFGRKLSVNSCDWNGKECNEMQISVKQDDSDAFIDIDKEEGIALRDKLNEWIGDNKKYSKKEVNDLIVRYEKHCMGENYIASKHIIDEEIEGFINDNF